MRGLALKARSHHLHTSSLRTLRPPPNLQLSLATCSSTDSVSLYFCLYEFSYLLVLSVFPPFWVIGACIIFTPLNAEEPPALQALPKDVEAGYASPAYEKAELGVMRKTELVWAKRCLVASLVFIAILIAVIVGARMATRH
jgi:hypothetical protein